MNSATCHNIDKSHKDNWMKEANTRRNGVMVRKEHHVSEILVLSEVLLVDLEAGSMKVLILCKWIKLGTSEKNNFSYTSYR